MWRCRPGKRGIPGRPRWWPDWRGETVVLIGGGPSAAEVDVEAARGRARVIAINNSWQLCRWADILYACDLRWWERYLGSLREFGGLKLCSSPVALRRGWVDGHVRITQGDDRFQPGPPGTVGWAGNGGFHMLNLAVQMGARRVLLVGFDMRVDHGVHWHGLHDGKLDNPKARNVERWRRCMDEAAPVIAEAGTEVINCSRISALESWPKMAIEEALEC